MNTSFKNLMAQLQTASVDGLLLYGFSDLNLEEAKEVAAIWPALEVDLRRKIILSLLEISESDFEVDFGQIFRLALEDQDEDIREAAIEGLWEDEDVRLIPLLVTRLQKDDSPQVRAAAAQSLGRFLLLGELGKIRALPHSQAYQALMEGYRCADECTDVLRRLLESLAYSCEEEVNEIIAQAYRHPDHKMKSSAVFAMGRSGDQSWKQLVLDELNSSIPEMRFEATRACGELSINEAAPLLIEFVDDIDTEIQEAAIWALGQIGGRQAHQVLVACASADSEAKREVALDALQEYELLHGDVSSLLFPVDLYSDQLELDDDANNTDSSEEPEEAS